MPVLGAATEPAAPLVAGGVDAPPQAVRASPHRIAAAIRKSDRIFRLHSITHEPAAILSPAREATAVSCWHFYGGAFCMIRLRQLGIMMVSLALAGCGGAATPASNPPASAASAHPAASAAAKPSAPAAAAAASGAASAAAKPAASGAAAGKPSGEAYKLGVTYPLTGPLAAFGADILPGITIAVDDVNKAGGVMGHPLQLVSEDTKSTPEAGLAAMRKVVDVDKVPVVLTAFTNVVTAQMALADQVKVPIIAPAE